jgi:CBS domain-containing protein
MSFLGKDLNTAPQIRVARAMQVKDVMTRDVVTVRQGTSLPAAAELIVAKKVSGVPVVDADDRLVGILTEEDFMSAMNIDGGLVGNALTIVRKRRARKGMGTIVDDIMTRAPITIRTIDSLEAAVARMDRNQVKRLVVRATTGGSTGSFRGPTSSSSSPRRARAAGTSDIVELAYDQRATAARGGAAKAARLDGRLIESVKLQRIAARPVKRRLATPAVSRRSGGGTAWNGTSTSRCPWRGCKRAWSCSRC